MKARDAATHRRISREDGGGNREGHSHEAKEVKDHRKLKEAGVTIPSEPAEGNLASAMIWDTGF